MNEGWYADGRAIVHRQANGVTTLTPNAHYIM